MKRILRALLCAAAAFGSGSCINNAHSDKPVITVSIEPQRWLLEQIVGDRMEVRTLLDNGGNPESCEPSFAHMARLEESVCYMQVGNLGFETALVDRIRANNPDLAVITTSDSITYIIGDEHDHGHGHGIDPHVWSSAPNARIMARNMLREVESLDPDNAAEYRANYQRLVAGIDSVDSECRRMLAESRGESFMVWHPSLSYFARDYGLHQIAIGAEGKEQSVGETRQAVDRMNRTDAAVFLVQKDFDSSRAEAIADKGSMRVVTINPLNYHWDDEMLQTARAIAGK